MANSIMHDRTYPLLDFCKKCNGWHIPIYACQPLFTTNFGSPYAQLEIIHRATGEIFTPDQFRTFVTNYRSTHHVIRRNGTAALATEARVPSALALAQSAEKTFL